MCPSHSQSFAVVHTHHICHNFNLSQDALMTLPAVMEDLSNSRRNIIRQSFVVTHTHTHLSTVTTLLLQDDLMTLPAVKERKSAKMLQAINASKAMPLKTLLAGLAIQ
jgi:NAD-dependent DNA ligase